QAVGALVGVAEVVGRRPPRARPGQQDAGAVVVDRVAQDRNPAAHLRDAADEAAAVGVHGHSRGEAGDLVALAGVGAADEVGDQRAVGEIELAEVDAHPAPTEDLATVGGQADQIGLDAVTVGRTADHDAAVEVAGGEDVARAGPADDGAVGVNQDDAREI